MSDTGFVVWFTGYSGAGKSTLAEALTRELEQRGLGVEVLDGDVVRTHLSKGLTFSRDDRDINVRRIGWVARTLARHGAVAVCAAISPYRAIREEIRAQTGRFLEVFVDVPLEVAESRDVKGLYRKARAGEIPAFTGVDDPYEPPASPEVVCRTHEETVAQSVGKILRAAEELGFLAPPGEGPRENRRHSSPKGG